MLYRRLDAVIWMLWESWIWTDPPNFNVTFTYNLRTLCYLNTLEIINNICKWFECTKYSCIKVIIHSNNYFHLDANRKSWPPQNFRYINCITKYRREFVFTNLTSLIYRLTGPILRTTCPPVGHQLFRITWRFSVSWCFKNHLE